jgi:flagellin
MPLSINTNIASLNAQRSFLNSNASLETAFERLSTGKRVNSASDDAAGLAISKGLESHVSGLNQAIRNVNDGISMVQITEGALDEVTSILQRMRDLSVQAANSALAATERGYLDAEHSKLATTLGSVIDQAKFNNTDLVADSGATNVTVQSGANASDTTAISFAAMTENSLGVDATQIEMAGVKSKYTLSGITVATNSMNYQLTINNVVYTSATAVDLANVGAVATHLASADFKSADGTTLASLFDISESAGTITLESLEGRDFGAAISKLTNGGGDGTGFAQGGTGTTTQGGYGTRQIDAALATVAGERATLGAMQAQLESSVRNLANIAENTSAAAGRIMDTDYAAETANLTKAQILQQAATSILAQANAQPQSVLALLR